MIETDDWTFVQAKWYGAKPKGFFRPVRVGVFHDMEYPERPTAAEDIAKDFATRGPGQKSSAHVCVDSDSIVQCVHDRDVAYAAPGANEDGIHIEIPGYGRQTREEWLDPYGLKALRNGAIVAANYCLKYDLPVCHLTNTQLLNGEKGWVGHYQISEVYKKTDHTDPGPNFPWDTIMEMMAQEVMKRKARFGIK